ncbi:hypothetical protein D1AOALGA4SA_8105 [Olavius algarvensis Delta 1 endosymbiont]|nr:hypothetical protein D1AOALGA4SA_8105 [Olavius algarvensis Delta 1 endosymbiont]
MAGILAELNRELIHDISGEYRYVGKNRLEGVRYLLLCYCFKLGASPQLEWWNIGKMGFGGLACWVKGVIALAIKLKMDNIL